MQETNFKNSPPKNELIKTKHWDILIGFATIFVIDMLIIDIKLIGHDSKINFIVYYLPFILGFIFLFIIKFKELKNEYKIRTDKFSFLIVTLIVLSIFSCCIFMTTSRLVWEVLNVFNAKCQPTELIDCNIERFETTNQKYHNDVIYFTINGKKDYINIERRMLIQYKNDNPSKYSLQLIIKKGINPYYILQSWEITNKH